MTHSTIGTANVFERLLEMAKHNFQLNVIDVLGVLCTCISNPALGSLGRNLSKIKFRKKRSDDEEWRVQRYFDRANRYLFWGLLRSNLHISRFLLLLLRSPIIRNTIPANNFSFTCLLLLLRLSVLLCFFLLLFSTAFLLSDEFVERIRRVDGATSIKNWSRSRLQFF